MNGTIGLGDSKPFSCALRDIPDFFTRGEQQPLARTGFRIPLGDTPIPFAKNDAAGRKSRVGAGILECLQQSVLLLQSGSECQAQGLCVIGK